MKGELESIYNQYKQGIRQTDKNPLKISSPITTNNEVPNPVIDNEIETNISIVNTCPKCGSLNISIDIATNKPECRDCGEKSDKASKLNIQKMIENIKEEEQNKIDESLKRGDVFLK